MKQNVCLVCKQKSHNPHLNRLQWVKIHLDKYTLDTSDVKLIGLSQALASHEKCKYVISCPTMIRNNAEIERLARELEPKIIAYLEQESMTEMYKLFTLIQGYFPAARKMIEQYWFKYHNQIGGISDGV